MGKNKKKKRPKGDKKPREPNKLDLLARAMGRAMTKMRAPKEQVNQKVYCKDCGKHYCLGFDNVEVFCSTCFYKGDPRHKPDNDLPFGCQKETTGGRICRKCEGAKNGRLTDEYVRQLRN
jgi:hypothetical protein